MLQRSKKEEEKKKFSDVNNQDITKEFSEVCVMTIDWASL